MTKEEKLRALDAAERRVRKFQAKGYSILADINMASDYHGLGQGYAQRDFENAIRWMNSEIESKRKFVHNGMD